MKGVPTKIIHASLPRFLYGSRLWMILSFSFSSRFLFLFLFLFLCLFLFGTTYALLIIPQGSDSVGLSSPTMHLCLLSFLRLNIQVCLL